MRHNYRKRHIPMQTKKQQTMACGDRVDRRVALMNTAESSTTNPDFNRNHGIYAVQSDDLCSRSQEGRNYGTIQGRTCIDYPAQLVKEVKASMSSSGRI